MCGLGLPHWTSLGAQSQMAAERQVRSREEGWGLPQGASTSNRVRGPFPAWGFSPSCVTAGRREAVNPSHVA